MAAIPTIKVHYNGSWAYINQSDFDPEVHLEWQDGDEVIVESLKAKAEAEVASALFNAVEDEDEDEAEPVAEPTEPAAEPESEDSEDELAAGVS
jgi:hypothetical protein